MRELCDSEIPSVLSYVYISKIISYVGFRTLICKLEIKRKGGKIYFRSAELHNILSRSRRNFSLQFMSPRDFIQEFSGLNLMVL